MNIPERFNRYYVWTLPVRICHWASAICILLLSVTGFLIGHPVLIVQNTDAYLMGWVRLIHFAMGYTLLVSVLARLLWSLRDHCFSGWREYFPFLTTRGRSSIVTMLKYYFFINKKTPESVGHNPLAVTAYVALYMIFYGMFASGFALYAEYAPGGAMHAVLKPVYQLFSSQTLRQMHHLGMWVIAGFVINHIYSVWLLDVKEKGGEITSIFSGYKYTTSMHVLSEGKECDAKGYFIIRK